MKKNTFMFKMTFLFILCTVLFINIPGVFSEANTNTIHRPVVIRITADEYSNLKVLACMLENAQSFDALPKYLFEEINGNKKLWKVKYLSDDNCPASFSTLLEWVLIYYYDKGYQIKFITDTLIILEQNWDVSILFEELYQLTNNKKDDFMQIIALINQEGGVGKTTLCN